MNGAIVETIHDMTDWCGIYMRSVLLPLKGCTIEQHVHQYDHPTYCGNGSAEYWEDGALVGTVSAGGAVKVRAGKKHHFVALEDNTRLACVHDVTSAGGI